ncbi:hypothetical protein [Deinococcus sp. UYEF24]
MKRLLLLCCLMGKVVAGGGSPDWRTVDVGGHLRPSGRVQTNRPCPALNLPSSWHVLDQIYADVTGDTVPECVLVVWRPWKDWPIRRWSSFSRPSAIASNHDVSGDSAHLVILTPLDPGRLSPGRYRERWVGSALYQPVTALTVLPGGHLVTLETTYARGRGALSQNVSVWSWTGFGFRKEERWPVSARHLAVDRATRRIAVR